MDEEDFKKALLFAQKIISIRPRSCKEISDKLSVFSKKNRISVDIIERVIDRLKESDLINDDKFVGWWIEQRDYFKPKGKIALKTELRQKGIDINLTEKIISQSLNSRKTETELAITSLGKKLLLFKKLPTELFKRKISGFLSRRGFDYDTIEAVIDEVTKKS
jgi:regulatory protein